ncbi:hypothetical protein [Parasphingopyxis lamellibrachiae]|uniref:Uncharacterized protein n=1 Tax=Parasphingopyxis lamellibrachiae TaxID=680125 RepID=A0A3D9FCJ9_9SPHN|nr:hypothetical protein [Parasphingopyxis lamellibrachiae]RED15463.1 hypothetical protein DFR46_0457 [Parasphingopyxis lamellibrachiae]
MTNITSIRQNILSALAALAVTGVCVFGTVGPIDGGTAQPVQLQADQDGAIIVTGRIA